jgi:hypothetical protein
VQSRPSGQLDTDVHISADFTSLTCELFPPPARGFFGGPSPATASSAYGLAMVSLPRSALRFYMLTIRRNLLRATITVALLSGMIAVTEAQHRHGRGMMDQGAAADMQVFHSLFEHRADITRHVTKLSNGVDTLTESDNSEVTRLLQAHVDAMVARVKDGHGIHLRDPLFREIFRYADRITATVERTPKGVHVVETSTDRHVVTLLQAHADVVSAFLANGHAEMMKDHAVP